MRIEPANPRAGQTVKIMAIVTNERSETHALTTYFGPLPDVAPEDMNVRVYKWQARTLSGSPFGLPLRLRHGDNYVEKQIMANGRPGDKLTLKVLLDPKNEYGEAHHARTDNVASVTVTLR